MSHSVYSELSAFEKEQARRRRTNVNPAVSEQLRLSLAKEPFKNKQDTLARLIRYHNSYVEITDEVISEQTSITYTSEMDGYLSQRLDQLNQTISDPNYFRNFILNTACKSLRLEIPPPPSVFTAIPSFAALPSPELP